MAVGAFDYFQMPAELSLLIARTEQLVALKQTMDRLRAEADRDYLTGLANRRRFRTALGQEVERWRRYNVPCALVLVDIDHLKKINDTARTLGWRPCDSPCRKLARRAFARQRHGGAFGRRRVCAAAGWRGRCEGCGCRRAPAPGRLCRRPSKMSERSRSVSASPPARRTPPRNARFTLRQRCRALSRQTRRPQPHGCRRTHQRVL